MLPLASTTWSAKPVATPASKQEPWSSASEEGLPPLLDAEETAAVQAQLAQTGRGAMLYGAYWTLEEGFESELTISNAVDSRLALLVTLFATDGTPLDLPAMLLQPHAMHRIKISDLINRVDPTAMERGLREGSLRLRHTGVVPTMLAAQIGITHRGKGLAFDVPVELCTADRRAWKASSARWMREVA